MDTPDVIVLPGPPGGTLSDEDAATLATNLLKGMDLVTRCKAVQAAFIDPDDRIELMAWIDGKGP